MIESIDLLLGRTTSAPSLASETAARNWSANARALVATQTDLVRSVSDEMVLGEWVYGRDGALTLLDESAGWWAGCSLPRRAAQAMLKAFDAKGNVSAFLLPPHAAHVRVALDMLEKQQILMVVGPDRLAMRILLGCEDFSQDIAQHRLWLLTGDDWAAHLGAILAAHPGLPLPSQFVRVNTASDETLVPMMNACREVFANQTASRSAMLERLCKQTGNVGANVTSPRVCVVTQSHFELWNDAAGQLGAALCDDRSSTDALSTTAFVPYDQDIPTQSAPPALAMKMASECDALVIANVGRADLPGIVSEQKPWITWVTSPRIPAANAAGFRDGLLLADKAWLANALAAGWSRSQIEIAGWPVADSTFKLHANPCLGIIADTRVIEAPEADMEFSSHRLLWESILRELRDDPMALESDINRYLDERARQFEIADQTLNRRLFIDSLILPAYLQGLARVLIAGGLPLRLWGNGWSEIGEFQSRAGGAITSREQLRSAIESTSALVHCWPTQHAHPIDAASRSVVRRTGRRRETLVREAKAALANVAGNSATVEPLSPTKLDRFVNSLLARA